MNLIHILIFLRQQFFKKYQIEPLNCKLAAFTIGLTDFFP